MSIPRVITDKRGLKWEYEKSYPNFHLYSRETGCERSGGRVRIRKAFTTYELGGMDNTAIDEFCGISNRISDSDNNSNGNNSGVGNYCLFDRILRKKKLYPNVRALSAVLDESSSVIVKLINSNKCLYNRWYICRLCDLKVIVDDPHAFTKHWYSYDDYTSAKELGLNLNVWDDYIKYYVKEK